MSTTATKALPCEQANCPEAATHIAMRIDASTDRLYACEAHAREYTRWAAAEATALPPRRADMAPRPGPNPCLELVLAMWPPRHRGTTQRAAKAILAADGVVTL